MADRSERELLGAIRAGQREACAELIRVHYERIYRLLVHLTRCAVLAEDLTQETFATAWEKIGDFEGRSSLGTWLHRIAYGKFVDARRAQRRRSAAADKWAARDVHSVPAGPLEVAGDGDEARHLRAALDRLNVPDREVLVLHYLQGLSYREMAEVLGEPAGTIKWRTSQALERLRTILTSEANHDRPRLARG